MAGILEIPVSFSQRLLRKGALVEETYRLFETWDKTSTIQSNLSHLDGQGFRTEAWKEEVRRTLQARFGDFGQASVLIALAKNRMPLESWRICLNLWIAVHEPLYGDFLTID